MFVAQTFLRIASSLFLTHRVSPHIHLSLRICVLEYKKAIKFVSKAWSNTRGFFKASIWILLHIELIIEFSIEFPEYDYLILLSCIVLEEGTIDPFSDGLFILFAPW